MFALIASVAHKPKGELGIQVLQSMSIGFFLMWLFGAFGALPPSALP